MKVLRTRKFSPRFSSFICLRACCLEVARRVQCPEFTVELRNYPDTPRLLNNLQVRVRQLQNHHLTHASCWKRPTFLHWRAVSDPLSSRIIPDFIGILKTNHRGDGHTSVCLCQLLVSVIWLASHTLFDCERVFRTHSSSTAHLSRFKACLF